MMRLLVSVANAGDAAAALAGGADLIDAKNPSAGALGAVDLHSLHDIVRTVGGERPVTAALGDATTEHAIEHAARRFALGGAELVKIGFAGVSRHAHLRALIGAAVNGAGIRAGVVAVAYADSESVASPSFLEILDAAASAGAAGILLDTADKSGPGLRALILPGLLASWVAAARDAGLLVALAGKLTIDDLDFVRDAGADIAGVRGAACDGGRAGRVVAARVRRLQSAVRRSTLAPAPDPAAACG